MMRVTVGSLLVCAASLARPQGVAWANKDSANGGVSAATHWETLDHVAGGASSGPGFRHAIDPLSVGTCRNYLCLLQSRAVREIGKHHCHRNWSRVNTETGTETDRQTEIIMKQPVFVYGDDNKIPSSPMPLLACRQARKI